MISRHRQPTGRAVMPAIPERFGDRCATRTALRGALRVDLHPETASFHRFAKQDEDERAPGGVQDRLGEHAPRQALDVQGFDGDQPVLVDELPSNLVMKIAAVVPNVRVQPLQGAHRFPPAVAAFLAPGDLALRPSELHLGRFEVAGIVDPGPIRQRGEGLQADIQAHRLGAFGQGKGLACNAEADIPVSRFALQGDGLDRPLERAMPFHFQLAHTLDIELPVVPDLATIAIAGKGIAVEAGAGLEARVARFFAPLPTSKEGFERLVDPPQHILAGGEIRQAEMSGVPNRFELVRLIVVGQRGVCFAVRIAALLERGVVQETGFAKLGFQGFPLSPRRIDSIPKGFLHLRGFLGFDVGAYRGVAHVADRSRIVRPAPQRGQAGAQVRKVLAQRMRSRPLHAVHDFGHRPTGIGLDKQVHVIRHDLQRVNAHLQFDRLGPQQLFQPGSHGIDQHRTPVLGAPDDVIFEREHRSGVFGIASLHTYNYIPVLYLCQGLSQRCQRKDSALRAAPFPLVA
jgi:hypothetical protein